MHKRHYIHDLYYFNYDTGCFMLDVPRAIQSDIFKRQIEAAAKMAPYKRGG